MRFGISYMHNIASNQVEKLLLKKKKKEKLKFSEKEVSTGSKASGTCNFSFSVWVSERTGILSLVKNGLHSDF